MTSKIAKLRVILSLLQMAAVTVVFANNDGMTVSPEAIEEFCKSAASAVPGEHSDACVKSHVTLADLNKSGKDAQDYILDGLKLARSELQSVENYTALELDPATNNMKQPRVFHVIIEGCKDGFNMSAVHLDRAVNFFTDPDALNNKGPIPDLVQGLADVMILTGGCIDAMSETGDRKLEKTMGEKLLVLEEQTSLMSNMILTVTGHSSRMLLRTHLKNKV